MKLQAYLLDHVRRTSHLPLSEVRDRHGKPHAGRHCGGCNKKERYPGELAVCSKCKAVAYCRGSKKCQLRDWKGKGCFTAPRGHKECCKELAEAREEFQTDENCGEALRKTLFRSWADQHHSNGAFFDTEFRIRKRVYGTKKVGFWARPNLSTFSTPFASSGEADTTGFRNGDMLLQKKFPSLKKGWHKLGENEYPVGSPASPPPPEGIRNWREYFEYRQLDPKSIAPLLLNYVLTVYQMIHHELRLTKKSKTLKVSLLGVESELNFIPLFAELAYLLPGIDLELIMTSPTAKGACDRSKKYPGSILNKSTTVLDFRAPINDGGGRLRVTLDPMYNFWCETDFNGNYPDAVIGLNAGLGSYEPWKKTLFMLLSLKIPFAFSEHARPSLRFVEVILIPDLIPWGNYQVSPFLRVNAIPSTEIKLNPFNAIVNRDISALLIPNIENGYLFVWKTEG